MYVFSVVKLPEDDSSLAVRLQIYKKMESIETMCENINLSGPYNKFYKKKSIIT